MYVKPFRNPLFRYDGGNLAIDAFRVSSLTSIAQKWGTDMEKIVCLYRQAYESAVTGDHKGAQKWVSEITVLVYSQKWIMDKVLAYGYTHE